MTGNLYPWNARALRAVISHAGITAPELGQLLYRDVTGEATHVAVHELLELKRLGLIQAGEAVDVDTGDEVSTWTRWHPSLFAAEALRTYQPSPWPEGTAPRKLSPHPVHSRRSRKRGG